MTMETQLAAHIKNEQGMPATIETNHLGQVKISSSSKTGKWVWVNAKQFRGILKCRATRLKWDQTRKKKSQRESILVLHKKQPTTAPLSKRGRQQIQRQKGLYLIQPHIYTSYLVI